MRCDRCIIVTFTLLPLLNSVHGVDRLVYVWFYHFKHLQYDTWRTIISNIKCPLDFIL